MTTMCPMLTWAQWLASPGFGGAAAVFAAVLALIGVGRASAVQRANARKDQWWDRLKWAVDLVLSGEEEKTNVGIAALSAITEAHGFDRDEINFLVRIANIFLEEDPQGILEESPERGEEDQDGSDHS